MYLRFSPFEGSRVAVVVFDEFIDRMAQLSNTGKVGSLQGLAAQDTKPNLNLIEPRGVSWSEMKMHIGVSSQPTILFWLNECSAGFGAGCGIEGMMLAQLIEDLGLDGPAETRRFEAFCSRFAIPCQNSDLR